MNAAQWYNTIPSSLVDHVLSFLSTGDAVHRLGQTETTMASDRRLSRMHFPVQRIRVSHNIQDYETYMQRRAKIGRFTTDLYITDDLQDNRIESILAAFPRVIRVYLLRKGNALSIVAAKAGLESIFTMMDVIYSITQLHEVLLQRQQRFGNTAANLRHLELRLHLDTKAKGKNAEERTLDAIAMLPPSLVMSHFMLHLTVRTWSALLARCPDLRFLSMTILEDSIMREGDWKHTARRWSHLEFLGSRLRSPFPLSAADLLLFINPALATVRFTGRDMWSFSPLPLTTFWTPFFTNLGSPNILKTIHLNSTIAGLVSYEETDQVVRQLIHQCPQIEAFQVRSNTVWGINPDTMKLLYKTWSRNALTTQIPPIIAELQPIHLIEHKQPLDPREFVSSRYRELKYSASDARNRHWNWFGAEWGVIIEGNRHWLTILLNWSTTASSTPVSNATMLHLATKCDQLKTCDIWVPCVADNNVMLAFATARLDALRLGPLGGEVSTVPPPDSTISIRALIPFAISLRLVYLRHAVLTGITAREWIGKNQHQECVFFDARVCVFQRNFCSTPRSTIVKERTTLANCWSFFPKKWHWKSTIIVPVGTRPAFHSFCWNATNAPSGKKRPTRVRY